MSNDVNQRRDKEIEKVGRMTSEIALLRMIAEYMVLNYYNKQ